MRYIAIIAVALMASLGSAHEVRADDDKVQLSDLPAQVRQTVEREAHGASVTEIEQDMEDGKVIYEVEILKQGQRWELDIDTYGRVLDRHRD